MTSDRSSGATPAGSSGEPRHESTDYETTGYERRETVPVREETVVHEEARPMRYDDDSNGPVNVAVGAERRDGVRWGPIWAGLLTALTTFLLLELLFFALGWLTLDPGTNDQGSSADLVTGILALVGFFLGGLVAAATALWKGLTSGLLHGFMVWALGVATFLVLTFLGAGTLLGSFGSLANQFGVGPQEVQQTTNVDTGDALANAKDAAWPAFLGLFLPLAASLLGGLVGSKMWPRQDDTDPDTVRMRS